MNIPVDIPSVALAAMAPAYLVALNIYNWNEKRLARKYYRRYIPTPLPVRPTLYSDDVSIVVPTIDTEDTFVECMELWLENKPKEIIIVTIDSEVDRVTRMTLDIPLPQRNLIRVSSIPIANKRRQIIHGIRYARGAILALVDDDTFWPTDRVIHHLLAPFEDKDIGACGGTQMAHLDEWRKDENVITPWEVAALRAFDGQSSYLATRSQADGGVWCLVGRTIFVRAELLKSNFFCDAFANEFWFGKKLNTGDDVFITRWVLQIMRKAIAVQDCPEATVTTTIKRDSGFGKQMIRWQRSTLMMLITHLFVDPGFFALYRRFPYMARKMLERLIRPCLNLMYMVAFAATIRYNPLVCIPIMAWHAYQYYCSYKSFLERYPYCRKHMWAVVLFDHNWLVLDPYTWLTIGNDDWLTRHA